MIVPYTLWKVYGDRRVLEENYDMMKRWVERCRKLAETSRPETKEKAGEYAGYIIDTGFTGANGWSRTARVKMCCGTIS